METTRSFNIGVQALASAMKDISSFPFDETIRHTGHTCLTVVSSGLSIASQSIPDPGIVRGGDACGRPPNDYDRRVVQTRR